MGNIQVKLGLTMVLVLFCGLLGAQNKLHIDLKWEEINEENGFKSLRFDAASFEGTVPYYYKAIKINNANYDVRILKPIYTDVEPEQLSFILGEVDIPKQLSLSRFISKDRTQYYIGVKILPFIRSRNGTYKKLSSFELELLPKASREDVTPNPVLSNTSHSLMRSGKWLKLEVAETGVYKILVQDLIDEGLEVESGIRLFGYGGKSLSGVNADAVLDDMEEMSLIIDKGSDNVLNGSDYIYFYAEGPVVWRYEAKPFRGTEKYFAHYKHSYSKTISYFIASGLGEAKPLVNQAAVSSTASTQQINVFKDHFVYENDLINLLKTGRTWFGKKINNVNPSIGITANFPNIVGDSLVELISKVAARAPVASEMRAVANGSLVQKIAIPKVNFSSHSLRDYVRNEYKESTFTSHSDNINVNFTYNKSESYYALIDYVKLLSVRELKKENSFLSFTNIYNIGGSNRYTISNVNENTLVWNISDLNNVLAIKPDYSGQSLSFVDNASEAATYLAFNKSDAKRLKRFTSVANQDLHGMENVEYVILTHRNFKKEANELAEFHRTKNGLNTIVVTNEQVYNEFSSGTPDVTALRNYMRHLYFNKSLTDTLKYLLLFGDGSYDNISNDSDNTNFILTYQSVNSTDIQYSFVTDDYYGLLDPEEFDTRGYLDIGIGRMVIQSKEQAQSAVNKVIHYAQKISSFGSWRNKVTFAADNGNGNLHMLDAEKISVDVETNYPDFNLNKIYMDSYPLIQSAGSDAVPEMNKAINSAINEGTLIFNYTGHGNERGLAHENVVTLAEISSWNNFDKLAVFVTATCEFTRFDDKDRVSAGEMVFLNPKGGGIALFTTTRIAFSSSNFAINKAFYNQMRLARNYTMGDCIRRTKNAVSNSSTNMRIFTLIGDPALSVPISEFNVTTQSLNGVNVGSLDSLKVHPLETVTIKGQVVDKAGNKQNDFNGVIYPLLYDKPDTTTTLCQGSCFKPMSYKNFRSIIYRGKASVKNGNFSFSFVVPKDVSYRKGFGKISYYATNNRQSASGNNGHLAVLLGGSSSVHDSEGPKLDLFMNDEDFIYGSTTNEEPILLAKLFDEHGINTVGNGIGHDIVAELDKNTKEAVVLNDYYQADMDSYQSGTVRYPYKKLKEGKHTIHFKAWDVFNNSSEQQIEFFVSKSSSLVIKNILNYPNPFTDNTSFYFDHNQANKNLEVLIQVFTVSGKLVKSIETSMLTDGFRSEAIPWNGKDDYEDPIGRGVYIYKVKVKNEEGESVTEFEKLVILK